MQLKVIKVLLVLIFSLKLSTSDEEGPAKCKERVKPLSLQAKIHVFILKMMGKHGIVENCKIFNSSSEEDDPYFKQLARNGKSRPTWGPITSSTVESFRSRHQK
jgi:hypothetical protein